MTVVAEVEDVKVVVAGLLLRAVHVPIPVAAIVAVEYWQIIWSGPALGLAVTITLAVSVHPLAVHTYPYVPASVNPLIDVVGEAIDVMTVDVGLPGNAVHVPIPVAAIVAVVY
jgi:hypothetical protein